MTEKNIFNWLKRYKSTMLHMERVENKVSRGTPDVEGCYKGVHFNLELKYCLLPKKEDSMLNFKTQPSQPPWWKKRVKSGGNVFIIIQIGKNKHMIDLRKDTENKISIITKKPKFSDIEKISFILKEPGNFFNYLYAIL